MPNLVFKNLVDMKIFNNRRIAIYYLNNLHPLHERFDLDDKDTIKQLVETGFVGSNEIDTDITDYFKTNLRHKPYIQKLAREHFIHQENSHTFTL